MWEIRWHNLSLLFFNSVFMDFRTFWFNKFFWGKEKIECQKELYANVLVWCATNWGFRGLGLELDGNRWDKKFSIEVHK
jgi:hypothetical protein